MTLYHFFNGKTKSVKKKTDQKMIFCLLRGWGYPSDTNNVFKAVIVSTSSFSKGDFILAYNGKIRVLMGFFIRLTCKKKTKRRWCLFFDWIPKHLKAFSD